MVLTGEEGSPAD